MTRRLIILVMLLISARAYAHDPGLSSVTLQRDGHSFSYRVLVNNADLSERHKTTCAAQDVLQIAWNASAVDIAPQCRSHGPTHTIFEGRFELQGTGELTLRLPLLAELPRGHRSFARILDEGGQVIAQRLLGHASASLSTQLAAAAPPDFLTLGVEHIATGLDHLLFLTLLLLNVTTWRGMFAVVSCFTLAHSLTLALVTLLQLALPSQPVEVAIAGSIVWVAIRNALARTTPRERLTTTFGFGLIHGLGFAGALRELGVAGTGFASLQPLAWFNAGVELGQLAFGAVVTACCLRLRQVCWSTTAARVISAMAAALGLLWLLDRAA